MRRILVAFVLAVASLPAGALAEGASGGKPGTNIDMPILIAPMNDADGKLVSYAYVSSKLTAGSTVYALEVRDRLAFIQDAFVRDVNGASIVRKDNPAVVDIPALQARLLADAKRIMGEGEISAVSVTQIQIAPLRPIQRPADPPAVDSPAPAAEAVSPGG